MEQIYRTLYGIVRDRDEWREQHENLLSVRQCDLDAMQERVRAETERCEGIVAARKPGAIARWPRCVKSPSPHTGAQDHDRAS